ncbi:MAG: hypothetical protein ABIJ56_06160 [Pseudomonadota bacterium]
MPTLLTAASCLLFCSNKSNQSKQSTSYVAPVNGEKEGPSGPDAGQPDTPSRDTSEIDNALIRLIDETMPATGFAPMGPAAVADTALEFNAVKKSFMQGPGPCYVIIAACEKEVETVLLRAVGDGNREAPAVRLGEKSPGQNATTSFKVCPEADDLYQIQMKSGSAGLRCAVGIGGD